MSKVRIAKDNRHKAFHKKSHLLGHTNTLTLKISHKTGIGETLTILTGFPGPEISIFLLIAAVVGLMELPVLLLTESTL
jgi:hypothetical protein